MLEAGLQPNNCFLPLTYANDPGSLEPGHLKAFMKAFRKRVEPRRVRFYGVGEYGEKNDRPHYHVAMFNHPTCLRPGRRLGECTCDACAPVIRAWDRGFIYNLPLEMGSARYIARYVVKKMTRFDDPRLGANRHPEFSRQSNRPGIGYGVLDQVAELITRHNLLTPQGDVPVTLRIGSVEYPLGRYLRKKLRGKLGLDERSPHVLTPEAAYASFHSEENAAMRSLQKTALADKENPGLKHHTLIASKTVRDQIEKRNQLFTQKGKL